MQQKSMSEGMIQVLEQEPVLSSDGNKSMCKDATDSRHTFTEKNHPQVFVFGAAGSGESGFKSSAPQQTSFQSSLAASFSRLRTSKPKRHNGVLRGKGLAPLGCIGFQQSLPIFSRDVSLQSNTGLDSATELPHFDEANCSDAGVWPNDNIGVSIDLEEFDVLQSECTQGGDQSEAVIHNQVLQEGFLSTDKVGNVLDFDSNWQDQVSFNQKPQEDYSYYSQDTQHGTDWQILGMRLGSWWPFQIETAVDGGESWEWDGSLKTLKEKYNPADLVDSVDEPIAAVEQGDPIDVNLSLAYADESNLKSSLGGFPEVPEPTDEKFIEEFFVEEPTQNIGDETTGKNPRQPFGAF